MNNFKEVNSDAFIIDNRLFHLKKIYSRPNEGNCTPVFTEDCMGYTSWSSIYVHNDRITFIEVLNWRGCGTKSFVRIVSREYVESVINEKRILTYQAQQAA